MSDSTTEPLNNFAKDLIQRKAVQLSKHRGFSPTDREDLAQHLRCELIRRIDRFDPEISHFNVFVTTVVERAAASMLEFHNQWMRSPELVDPSLDSMIEDPDGHPIPKVSTLDPSCDQRKAGRRIRIESESYEMTADVASTLSEMPEQLADVCERLKTQSVSQVARDLGIPRRTLRDWLQQIKARFEDAALRDYL